MLKGRKYISIIPNFITLLGLLCGSVATVLALRGEQSIIIAAYLVFIAAFLDFFDGFTARLLKAETKFGKQFDSLSDLISFGMAPAAIMFELLKKATKAGSLFFEKSTEQAINSVNQLSPGEEITKNIIIAASFLIVIFSAIRLAKFNIDKRQEKEFLGLPTPALAIMVAAFPLITSIEPKDFVLIQLLNFLTGFELPFKAILYLIGLQVYVFEKVDILLPIAVFGSILLVINMPMFSLKFQGIGFRKNAIRYIFLFLCLVLIILMQSIAFPVIIITYILMSVLRIISTQLKRTRYKDTKKHLDNLFKEQAKIS